MVWKTERDGVIFILSDDKLSVADKFVYLNPYNKEHVLFGTEMLKYTLVSTAKLVFHYTKNKDEDFKYIIYDFVRPTNIQSG